jgi:RsiW-degrading membrane proteinase PrsW (M82 family)
MNSQYLYILLSVILGILCIRFLRRYDIHEKEPLWAMAAVTVWGGFWSVAFAVIGYWTLGVFGVEDPSSRYGPLLIVGPVEETAKLLALASSYPIIRRELDEPTDGLIYMACVALGFSLIENYLYTVNDPGSGTIFALRLVVCTPMHILFSAFMGLAFFQVVKGKARMIVLLIALLYGSIVHGIYDLAILMGWTFWVLIVLAWLSFWWVMKLLSYTSATSPHRRSLTEFVAVSEEPSIEPGLECLNCGSKNDKSTYRQGRIVFQKCDCCSAYVIGRKALFQLFRHYGGAFGRLGKYYYPAVPGEGEFASFYGGNYISAEKELAFFFLDELNEALETMNRVVITRHERNSLFRWFVGV